MKIIKILSIFIISFFIIFFIIKSRESRNNTVINTGTRENLLSEIPESKTIDFNQFVYRVYPESTLNTKIHNVRNNFKNFYIPVDIEDIIEKIKLKQYQEALDELERISDMGGPAEKSWAMYFKAHITFLQGRYSYALRLFKEFMEDYPSHELYTNAEEAARYINEWF
ncbi:MAG: hypothetical protein WC337_10300 [Candidatus Muiribacteriota bacterium]